MNEPITFLLKTCAAVSPLVLTAMLSMKINLRREERHRQIFMPLAAMVFCIVAGIYLAKINAMIVYLINQIYIWIDQLGEWLAGVLDGMLVDLSQALYMLSDRIEALIKNSDLVFWAEILANTAVMTAFLAFKPIVMNILKLFCKDGNAVFEFLAGSVYYKNEQRNRWYVKKHFSQGITLMKTLYIASIVFAVVGVSTTAFLFKNEIIASLYYPVFSVILVGEIYFFMDGEIFRPEYDSLDGEEDRADMVCDYSIMRKFLRRVFGDKLLSEDTTINNTILNSRTNDEVVSALEGDDDLVVEAYGKFMRKKLNRGLDLDQGYLMSGLDLLLGKSVLFNNPFYYDLIPYIFYPMNRAILQHKKVLIILGRHSIEEGVADWCRTGLSSVNHLPTLWEVEVLDGEKRSPDVGIITRSSVHDLKLHEANEEFFSQVGFVVLIEPSKLVATAQIGLNSIVRYCRRDGNRPVFCSTDKNCDGIVDALSHILMTNLVEVSATNRHGGTSSYMCWDADEENLQHRLLPNISRYLGVGTELSFAALKNQISKTVWYGGESFPVLDMHWIAKQYHHDLLSYASLPTAQSFMDEVFHVSPNMWEANLENRKYITVEDENCNMFEVKREFSTRAKKQGFINVISSDYLLKDYMADNDAIFNTDSKAIPNIVADYADSERNLIYRICLRLSSCHVTETELARELSVVDMDIKNIARTLWEGICRCSCNATTAHNGNPVTDELHIPYNGKIYTFTPDVICMKRLYSYKTGNMENMYSITDKRFINAFLGDLCCAEYITEDENGVNRYLGTELRGHVFQKHLPGQFFTFGGKYYEMLRLSTDGKVVVRRAADHINGRPHYRQVRNYVLHSAYDSQLMGDVKDIGGIRVSKQFADITVETPAYWQMSRYNDFETAKKISINGVPVREYQNKHILKIDFEEVAATPEVIRTIVLLMNELFRTLYADNHSIIVAACAGDAEAPHTFSLHGDEGCPVSESSIYIIEDSQLDVGLLVSVERNLHKIFTIICDYLNWHFDTYDASVNPPAAPVEEEPEEEEIVEKPKKKCFLGRVFGAIGNFFKKLFKRKPKAADAPAEEEPEDASADEPVVDAPGAEEADAADEQDEEPLNESRVLFSADAPLEDASLEYEPISGQLVGANMDRKRRPYHERYYLLYGGEKMPDSINPAGTLEFLKKCGYGYGFLEQARVGKAELEKMEKNYVPGKQGVRFCDFCGVELTGTEYEILADGRERCISCGRTAVKSEKEFKDIYETVARNMRTLYGVVINEPIRIQMVNAKKLHSRLGKTFVPTGKADGRVLGVAIKDRSGYSILIENGSPRAKSMMTMVHELTHIWQYTHWDAKAIKKMYGKKDNLLIYEGMAKWSEIQYAYLINETGLAKREEIITRMRDDEYGHGFNRYTDVYPLSTTTTLKGATPFDDPAKPL